MELGLPLRRKVKKRLIDDNHKMERFLLVENLTDKDKFISFCTSAFHQIENLVNYYYWSKFDNIELLLNYLFINNPSFKSRYKTIEKTKGFKKISDLNINVLVYLYEKEFYFDKKKFYKQELTKIREIRNDDSHRCSVIDVDKKEIAKEFNRLEQKKINFKKNNKNLVYSKVETKFLLKYETYKFLEKKNYKAVREILREVSVNIKNTLPNTV